MGASGKLRMHYRCAFKKRRELEKRFGGLLKFSEPQVRRSKIISKIPTAYFGAPGFEPGVICSQSRHVSRYTTPRGQLQHGSTAGEKCNYIPATAPSTKKPVVLFDGPIAYYFTCAAPNPSVRSTRSVHSGAEPLWVRRSPSFSCNCCTEKDASLW
jgi:hypothetical protein